MRSDIQALRGLAILLVLVYHADLGVVSSGYLGVDLFFVVSGFVIASMIRRQLEAGRFSFADFYWRRAKRLLPAAYVVFLLTSVLSAWLLPTAELIDYAKQLVGAVTFSGNIVLYRQAGYFGGAAEFKPLLHVWSLAIEEQFYFIAPFLMALLAGRLRLLVFVGLACLSLPAYLWISSRNFDLGFYLLPFRAWELLVGVLLALVLPTGPQQGSSGLRKLGGLLAIAVLLAVSATGDQWLKMPYAAMLTCLATACLICLRTPWLERGPAAAALIFLGNISYSLYLVHWPLLAMARHVWIGEPPAWAMLAIVSVSVFISWILWRFLENPVRHSRTMPSIKGVALIALASIVLFFPLLTRFGDVSAARQVPDPRRFNNGYGAQCEFNDHYAPAVGQCQDIAEPQIMVWGDSYAMHLVAGVRAFYAQEQGVAQATKSYCAPLDGLAVETPRYPRKWSDSCLAFNESVLRHIESSNSIRRVYVSSAFRHYLVPDRSLWNGVELQQPSADLVQGAMLSAVRRIRRAGKSVSIVSPPPWTGADAGLCATRRLDGLPTLGARHDCGLSRAESEEKQHAVNEVLSALRLAGADVLSLPGVLCGRAYCQTIADGQALYRDEGHLSFDGSRYLMPELLKKNGH